MSRYEKIINWVFQNKYSSEKKSIPFSREDLEEAARDLGIPCPKNLGDVIYTFRFRGSLPDAVASCAPPGKEWVIRGTGKSTYAFDLVKQVRILPNENMVVTKIPDATPEIISATAQGDEQSLLALIRYNKLIDIFLELTTYSLQNHLRTTAKGIGQVEIDEIYVGVDRFGQQYVIPVQAKGHNDEIGITQPEQDLAVCQEKWPNMIARSVAVQFMADGVIAVFELVQQDGSIKVAREAHYKLVPYAAISAEDRVQYGISSQYGESCYEF